ncbi:AAA family ATPase [Anoxybacillus flavithermus]|uniref:AAA family ATPase n=1 Tax=Anoxybacillus flavithermus TaxID=33934 RepID=UPI0030B93103
MKVNSLTYYYKDQVKPVLDKLCIEFETGKLNVIIGPNGAGKTTLLDIISGVISTNQFKSPFSEKDLNP